MLRKKGFSCIYFEIKGISFFFLYGVFNIEIYLKMIMAINQQESHISSLVGLKFQFKKIQGGFRKLGL